MGGTTSVGSEPGGTALGGSEQHITGGIQAEARENAYIYCKPEFRDY